jgi:hypothetical protein
MMAGDNELNLDVVVNIVRRGEQVLDQITAKLNEIGGASGQYGSGIKQASAIADAALQTTLSRITALSTGFMALQSGVGLLGSTFQGILGPIKESIELWSQSAVKAKQVEVAWEASGRALPVDKVKQYAQELSKVTTYSAADFNNVIKRFAGIQTITDDMMPRMMKLTADVASFSGKDLGGVGMMMSRLAQGNYQALSRFSGLRISPEIAATKDLDKILADIERRVAGMSGAAMDQWAGKSAKINEYWTIIKKQIGEIVGTALLDTLDGIKSRTEAFKDALKSAYESGKFEGLQNTLRVLGATFLSVRDTIMSAATQIWNGIKRAFGGESNFWGTVQSLITGVGTIINWVVKAVASLGENKWVLWAAAAYAAFKALLVGMQVVQNLWDSLTVKVGAITELIKKQTDRIEMNTMARVKNAVTPVASQLLSPGQVAGSSTLRNQAMINASGVEYAGRYTAGMQPPPGRPPLSLGMPVVGGLLTGAAHYAAGGGLGESLGTAAISGAFYAIFSNAKELLGILGKLGLSVAGFVAQSLGLASVGVMWDLVKTKALAAWAVMARPAGLVGAAVGIAALIVYPFRQAWLEVEEASKASIDAMIKHAQERGGSTGKQTKVKPEDITGLPLDKLQEERNKASESVTALRGEMLKAKAEEKGDDVLMELQARQNIAKENVELLNQTIPLRIKERDAILAAIAAQDSGKTEDVLKTALERVKTYEDRVKDINNAQESFLKATEAYFKGVGAEQDVFYQRAKNAVAANTQSAEEAAVKITQIEIQQGNARIATARQQYEVERAEKQKNFDLAMELNQAEIERLTKTGQDTKKLLLEREELSKKAADERVADEQKVTDAVDKETKDQVTKIQALYEARRDLQTKVADLEVSSAKSLSDIAAKSMTEWGRLQNTFREASTELDRAVALMPTQPQKALELAQKASQAFVGLAQDINALRNKVEDTAASLSQSYRDIRKATATPAEQWKEDVEAVYDLIDRAREAAGEGRYQEAETLYKQAQSAAVALAKGNAEVPEQIASGQARQLLDVVAGGLMATTKAELGRAEGMNKDAEEKVKQANQVQQEAYNKLMAINQAQINALTANTSSLDGLRDALRGGFNKQMTPTQQAAQQAAQNAGSGETSVTYDERGNPVFGGAGSPGGGGPGGGSPGGGSGGGPSGSYTGAYDDEYWNTPRGKRETGPQDTPEVLAARKLLAKVEAGGSAESGAYHDAQMMVSQADRAKKDAEIKARDAETGAMEAGLPLDMIDRLDQGALEKFTAAIGTVLGPAGDFVKSMYGTASDAAESLTPQKLEELKTETVPGTEVQTVWQPVIDGFTEVADLIRAGGEKALEAAGKGINVTLKVESERGTLVSWEVT